METKTENKKIKQSEVVWCESDNADATKTVYHGYYSKERKNIIGERYMGNSCLCNKNSGMMNANEKYDPIEEVENSGLNREKVCQSCLWIYDKLEK